MTGTRNDYSSAVIKHIISFHDARQASLAFFYFDFRDEEKKQDLCNFVTSLLCQLSAYSNLCCKILSLIYSTHGNGMQQPSNCTLTNCLCKMLSVTAEQPIFIIIDALNECPNVSGIPTP
jgi:NADH:ubiquinone oxidoreductase subunit E